MREKKRYEKIKQNIFEMSLVWKSVNWALNGIHSVFLFHLIFFCIYPAEADNLI